MAGAVVHTGQGAGRRVLQVTLARAPPVSGYDTGTYPVNGEIVHGSVRLVSGQLAGVWHRTVRIPRMEAARDAVRQEVVA